MIHPDDVAAWLVQVRQHPEAASGIIEALAARLIELDKQNEALRDELVRLGRTRAATVDEERVAALTRRVQTLEHQLELGVQVQPEGIARYLLVFALDGRCARVPLPDGEAWMERDELSLVVSHLRPRHLLVASEVDELLLFSDKGRAVRVSVADVSLAEVPVGYLALFPDLALDLDESIGVIAPLPTTYDRLTLVTRKGYARSFRSAEVQSLLERRLPLHSSPVQGDYPAFVLFSQGRSELLIATRAGKGVRFPERVVGVQAQQVIKLDRGDVVAGAAVVEDKRMVALVGAGGAATRREMVGFGAQSTAGNRGKILTRIDDVVAVAPVSADDVLWLLSANGKLSAVPAAQVPFGPGASSGKVVVRLGEDRLVGMALA